jgi:hypothetical protein
MCGLSRVPPLSDGHTRFCRSAWPSDWKGEPPEQTAAGATREILSAILVSVKSPLFPPAPPGDRQDSAIDKAIDLNQHRKGTEPSDSFWVSKTSGN